MIRALSGTPLLEDMIAPKSKFVGEALEQRDVRTIFVSAKEDDQDRENRVILLLGPLSAQKSELIDFFCNYFYGIEVMDQNRFHIADEKFNLETPQKPVQCYIFNETVMRVRPVILDVIACGDSYDGFDTPALINKWLLDNWKMRLDVIAVVFSDLHRMSMHEEDELQKVISDLPEHVRENLVVFITASDGSRTFEPLLRRFGLSDCPKYTINTSCIFQKQLEDRLNDEHRRRYWKMSINQFNTFMERVQETTPLTISGLPYIDDGIYGAQESSQNSSRNSVYSSSKSTVIEVGQKSRVQTIQQSEAAIRPTTSPPPPPTSIPRPKSPTVPAKPSPPPPPPKPILRPPPVPASPPPKAPTIVPTSVGIPLYIEKHPQPLRPQTADVSTTPKPPSFAPPVPPAPPVTDTSTTNALTNAMYEQLKQTRAYYDYVASGSEGAYASQVPNTQQPAVIGNRRHSVPDDVRHYADETTPPPVIRDIADRYSTVAYMNHEPTHYTTRIYSHSPTRSQVGVRDAHRLSRDDLRVVDAHSSPTDSQSEELKRMYSGRSGNSIKPTGDVTARYVYDTANRNYTTYGERQARESYTSFTNNDRKRWSRSSEPRSETFINDPYYGKDVTTGYGVIETRRSRTSLHSHGGSVPELIHSENKYDYQQLNPQQTQDIEQRSRLDNERRGRRQSEGTQQIYIDRRISPERQRKDQYSGTYTAVNVQEIPQYNLLKKDTHPPLVPLKSEPTRILKVKGGEVLEDERSIYEAYSQIHHQRPPTSQIGQGVQPQQQIPLQAQPTTQQYTPRYDQVPDQPQSNHYIIPKSMRGSQSSIHQIPSQQYDAYGEPIYVQRNLPLGVTEETTTTTTTTRNEEIERKRRKKKEEEEANKRIKENIGGGVVVQDIENNRGSESHYERYHDHHREAEQALIEEEYNTRHMKRTVEHTHKAHPGNGERRLEDGHHYNHTKQDGQSNARGKKTSSKTITKNNTIKWSPSNYSNPRDCFLNLLCFIIAPLVIILIIVVIIVFVIIQ